MPLTIEIEADETEPLPSSFYQGTNRFPGVAVSTWAGPEIAFRGDAANGAPTADSGAAAPTTRDVVESDIWRIEGDVLYFFNQYRGLQVIDVARPDAPVVLGTLSLPAAGEQMYVLPGKKVLLLARNGCGWSADSNSQALIVQVQDGRPVVVASLPCAGAIAESRLVGSALYVASRLYRTRPGSQETP